MKSEAAKGAGGTSPAKTMTMITPADPADQGTPTRVRAKPVTPRPSRVYAVELPSFEGPLDLLLHLVRRHELDILDIPIAFVTEKYLEYLSLMRALDIEILGDYLVMAATLAYLKSRELVPQQSSEEEGGDEDDEDGEDPREALIRRLIEYERFRAAGRELNEMPVIGRDVFARGGNIDLPPLDPGMAPVTLFRLTEAYARVLQRAQINKSHEVQLERVTVRQRMEQLSLLLDERESVDFESLFLEQVWGSVEELRQMLVVTLMSVLELVKLGIIGVRQTHDTESIHLQKRASHAEAMKALTSYSEDDSFGEGGGAAGGGQPVTPAVVGEPVAASPVAGEPAAASPITASPVVSEADLALSGVASRVAGEPAAASPITASPVVSEADLALSGVASPRVAAASPRVPESDEPVVSGPDVALSVAASSGGAEPDEPVVSEADLALSVAASSGVAESGEPVVSELGAARSGVVAESDEPDEPDEPVVSELGPARSEAVAEEDRPGREVVGGGDRDFSEDALGAMLASVRRLEAEEERGAAAVPPDAEPDAETLAVVEPGGARDSGRGAESEAQAPDSSTYAERESLSSAGDALGEDVERVGSALVPGLAGPVKEPRTELEAPQDDLDVNSGGSEPSFIDAMHDSGESHE